MSYSVVTLFGFAGLLYLLNLLVLRSSISLKAFMAHLISILIGIFYGLRNFNVGVDTSEYISRYANGTITEDYLFSYIGIIARIIGLSGTQYLIVIAVLTSLFLLHGIKNFSNDYHLAANFLILIAILPYGLMQFINISRQGLALSITIYGISLLVRGKKTRGFLSVLSALFVHKTTVLVYVVSHMVKKILASRFGLLVISVLIATGLIVSSNLHQLISLFSDQLASKYLEYSELDTSESSYLIILKISWALFHLAIISKLNKGEKYPQQLYYYLIVVVAASITLSPNPLVSSRLLASVDFLIPVLYSIPSGNRDATLRKFGIFTLILYAGMSPFLFEMYSVNLNW